MLDLQGQCFSFDHQIERDYSSVHSELVRQIRQPHATAHLSKSIFVVAIGGNDIILRALPPAVELTVEVAAVISLPPQEFIHSLEQTLRRQLQVCADSVCSY
jgi:fructoselysine-6-P-deglycase FrlB-like protein